MYSIRQLLSSVGGISLRFLLLHTIIAAARTPAAYAVSAAKTAYRLFLTPAAPKYSEPVKKTVSLAPQMTQQSLDALLLSLIHI